MRHIDIRFSRVAALVAAVFLAGSKPGSADPTSAPTGSSAPDTAWAVAERGQDYALDRSVRTVLDATGTVVQETNEFTLLENALH